MPYATTDSPRYLLYDLLGLVFMTNKAIISEKGSPIIGIIVVLVNPKFIQNSPIR